MRRARHHRAHGAESGDRASQILARASGIAAAIAVASLGLAYVAAQAGIAEPAASGGEAPRDDVEERVQVPSVASPRVEAPSSAREVLVEPDPVAPPVDEVISTAPGGSSGAPSDGAGDSPSDGAGGSDSDSRPGPGSDGSRGDGEEAWGDWVDWWESQRDGWNGDGTGDRSGDWTGDWPEELIRGVTRSGDSRAWDGR